VSRLAATLPLLLLLLPGCASLARSATTRFAEDLSNAILDQNDVATVRDGAPAYLLAMDGLIEGDPESATLLLSGARLYGSYASAFVEDEARMRRLWDRALGYGRRALCVEIPEPCGTLDGPFDEFAASLEGVGPDDVPTLYGFGVAWAGWVQVNAGDWRAVAQIPKLEVLMQRIVDLDESYDQGSAHLYLGVLHTLRPASLGGQPERGREHFERALAISERRNLTAQVLYARQYARLVFDRPLHDRLLREVVEADPRAPGLTLANTLAREQAQLLLDDADDYF
jgi:hypothetical protein